MTAGVERVRVELKKAASLVDTARRLLASGAEVNLSALEGKVRRICRGVIDMGLDEGRRFRPGMEALMADIDLLAEDLRHRYDPGTSPARADPES